MKYDPTSDFDDLDLGDARLDARARKIVKAFASQPAAGAPSLLTEAELEGYYRFLNNKRVTFSALLEAHRAATVARVGARDRLVIAHDTTDFRFSDETERAGLGPMDNGGQGFFAHFSLAVEGLRSALGVVGVEPWTRGPAPATKPSQRERYRDPNKESLRWARAALGVEEGFRNGPRLIHVMDREADDYDTLAKLVSENVSFVIRASFDRRIEASPKRLKTFARTLEVRFEREARLSSRGKNRPAKARKLYPPRDARLAKLALAGSSVVLRRPDKSEATQDALPVNVVHVHEIDPPAGCEPVEWILLTSEPIDTPEQILQVVEDYRARWVIEEYFKALKTGCAYEGRQNETKEALLNLLGISIPIAWSLLNMRALSRDEKAAERPATDVFTPTQLHVLALSAPGKLPRKPTVGQAVYAMARYLGGLHRTNGAPGWQILGRAFERLLILEAGWKLSSTSRKHRQPRDPGGI